MWIALVALVMMAGLLAVGCPSEEDTGTTTTTAPTTPKTDTGPADTGDEEPGTEEEGAMEEGGEDEHAGHDHGEATEGETEDGLTASSLHDAMEEIMGPGAQAIQAAIAAEDMEMVKAEAEKIRTAAEAAPELPGAPTDQDQLDEFTGYANDVVTDATALIEAADAGDMEKVTEAATAVKDGCKTCHDVFRTEE
jgi:cytochrome c556